MTKPWHPFLPDLLPAAEEPLGLMWSHFSNAIGAKVRYAFSPPPEGIAVRGHIVLLPGFREPVEKYFEAVRDLHARGFAVWMKDWRGQGGSERYLTAEPHKAHHLGYQEQLDTLHQFMTQHVLPGKPDGIPLYMMGHSMGGHLALRYLHDHNQPTADGAPGPITAALLTAPMVDISTGPLPKPIARQMAKFAQATGVLDKYVPGGGAFKLDPPPPSLNTKVKETLEVPTASVDLSVSTSKLTSCPTRINVMPIWFTRKPELALGDPTYGWVYHALQSVDVLNDKAYLENIKTPVLMQISGDDRVVDVIASTRAAGLLPNCTRLDIAEARHEIWMERDALRNRWLAAMDAFIAGGPGVAPAPKKPAPTGPKPPSP